MIKNSVILLSYNAWSLVMGRLSELAYMLPFDSELVWIDNGTTEEAAFGNMNWWLKTFPGKSQYYRFPENVGFPLGCNKGAGMARGENLIFLSSDVVVHRSYFPEVERILAANPDTLIGGRLVDWPGGWNEIQANGKKYVIPYAEGWFMALRRSAWIQLGGFDPSFSPADMEDVDLSASALALGMTLTAMNPGYFTHLGGKSFEASGISPNMRIQQTHKNKAYFDKKWSNRLEGLASCSV